MTSPSLLDSEMVKAGTQFLMEFFCAEWGGANGISPEEAAAAACGVIESALKTRPSLPEATVEDGSERVPSSQQRERLCLGCAKR